MLDKSDLTQIRKIIREEVENEVNAAKDELGGEINMARMRVQSSVDEVKDRVKNLEIRTTRMDDELQQDVKDLKKDSKMIKSDIQYIKKTLDVFIGRTDQQETLLKKRVTKIERHLNLPNETI